MTANYSQKNKQKLIAAVKLFKLSKFINRNMEIYSTCRYKARVYKYKNKDGANDS